MCRARSTTPTTAHSSTAATPTTPGPGTGGGGRLFSHLLGEPGATSFLLEGVVPYDKHAYLDYLSRQGRQLPAGYCSAESAVALARAARDRAMALTPRLERWPASRQEKLSVAARRQD